MAPSCALDEAGLHAQLERYRRVGQGAALVDRGSRHLVVQLDQHVNVGVVDAALAVERECCPFFTLDWRAPTRRLTISIAEPEHQPALDGIAFALGLGEAAGGTASD